MKKIEKVDEIVIDSPIGAILLRANTKALLFLDFTKRKIESKNE